MPTIHDHRLIFAHTGEPRVAASMTLAGVVAALVGAVFIALGPQFDDAPSRVAAGEGDAKAVRVVGLPAREDSQCSEQVWPHIDRRCLVRTEAKTPTRADTQFAKEPVEAKQDKAQLSPLNATGDAVVGKADAQAAAEAVAQPAPEPVLAAAEPVPLPQPAPPQRSAEADPQWSTETTGQQAHADEEVDEPPRRKRRRGFRINVQIGPFRF
jgi:hypothetical protein